MQNWTSAHKLAHQMRKLVNRHHIVQHTHVGIQMYSVV